MNGYMRYQCMNAWRRKLGLDELPALPTLLEVGQAPDYEELLKTEKSREFDELCKSRPNWKFPNAPVEPEEVAEWKYRLEQVADIRMKRKIMGGMRYGFMGDKTKPNYNRIDSMVHRLREYEKSGDIGLLADVSNLCELEFVEGTHPNRHLGDGDGDHHVEVKDGQEA